MMSNEEDVNWSDVPLEMAKQVLHQGEAFLQAQLSAAIAGDQRSMTSASIFVGFSAAILAASLAHWAEKDDLAIFASGIVGAAFMFVGSACCFWASRPVDFYYPGSHPEKWRSVIHQPLKEVIGGETENYQEMIEDNANTLASINKWLRIGMLAVVLAPILAFATWFYLSTQVGICPV